MAISALAHAGDNIVATSNLYGGSYNQLKVFLPRLGIQTKFVNGDNAHDIAAAIDDQTKAVYIETIGNPRYNVPDLEAIAKVAHEKGVPVIVRFYFFLPCPHVSRWVMVDLCFSYFILLYCPCTFFSSGNNWTD